jgi:hypothetical protein
MLYINDFSVLCVCVCVCPRACALASAQKKFTTSYNIWITIWTKQKSYHSFYPSIFPIRNLSAFPHTLSKNCCLPSKHKQQTKLAWWSDIHFVPKMMLIVIFIFCHFNFAHANGNKVWSHIAAWSLCKQGQVHLPRTHIRKSTCITPEEQTYDAVNPD